MGAAEGVYLPRAREGICARQRREEAVSREARAAG